LAVMRGLGEQVEPVEARCGWRLALAWPDEPMSTADVYAAYDGLAVPDRPGPSATEILEYLDGPAHLAGPFLVNDLEPAADNVKRSRFDLRTCLRRAGAEAVGMTGSGSAYFAIADSEADARRWADAARVAGAETHVAELLVDGTEQQGKTP